MFFIYIFIGSILGMTILLVRAYKNHAGVSFRLQNTDYWFSIDVAKVKRRVQTNFHRLSRPIVRSALHKLLEVYLRSIDYVRHMLRKHIKALLHYYAEEHDRLYHVQPSRFLAEMHAHKQETKSGKKESLKSLDEYSQ